MRLSLEEDATSGYRKRRQPDRRPEESPSPVLAVPQLRAKKVKDGHPFAQCGTRNCDARTVPSNRSAKRLRKAESETAEGSYSLFSVRRLMSCCASSSRMGWGRSIPASFHCISFRLSFTLNCLSGALSGGR